MCLWQVNATELESKLEAKLDTNKKELEAKMSDINTNMKELEAKMSDINTNMKALGEKVDQLGLTMAEIKGALNVSSFFFFSPSFIH